MKNILVLGGTGFVGRALCEQLSQHFGSGQAGSGTMGRLCVPTRRLAHAAKVQALPGVEVVQADVHNISQLTQLVAQADAVVNLVAVLHGSAATFEHVHVGLVRRIVQACTTTGVRRLVHISALGLPSSGTAPSAYLRSKAAGEAVLAQAKGSVATTVLRPSVIFGAGDQFMNLFAQLQSLAPVMPLAGGSAKLQPVWVEDVARAVVRSLSTPSTAGLTYECAGPRVYTLSELVRLAGRWSGHERPQIALPMALGRLQAGLLELLPGQPLMSRDNLLSLQVPNVASGQLPGLADLGISATALQAVAPQYLGPDFARAKLDRLRRFAGRQ